MERKKGNITTLMLGASTCSESRLSRLISHSRQATVIGFSAMTLLILAFPAQGGTIGFTNGSFDTPGLTASFAITNNLPGWTETGLNGFLDCLTVPGSATTDACGNGLQMWGGAAFPKTSPDGGNFILFDGDPQFRTLSQPITGLDTTQSYVVSFWQAAAQQLNFDGLTTELWRVCLDSDCQSSPTMHNASHGFVDWNFQSLTFAVTSANETLSFLAKGTPSGDPPFVLLDGVSVTAAPEPATCAFMGVGLLGVFAVRRQLKKRG